LTILSVFTSFLFLAPSLGGAEAVEFKKNETGLYRDVFDQNIYYEGTSYLRLDRLYNRLFFKKTRSKNLNVFDEVPDSGFFTNRHARKRLSAGELEHGYRENGGPDLSGDLTITSGKFEGLSPGFFVKDAKGDRYLIKFDPADYLELTTSAEIIASRFYHALGYNVPQYTIVHFEPGKLVPEPGAQIRDDNGFKKDLTKEKLEEHMMFLSMDAQGRYRASASKILEGDNKGNFSFLGRRKQDPQDLIPHVDRREIRALRVFSAWLNNNDVRESNTLDIVTPEGGKTALTHYLFDFNSSLGAAPDGPKPPMFGYEYMYDNGEVFKSFITLGLLEKPWQKRWREAGETVSGPAAIGYFDNRDFDPGKFKTQLPYYAFKDVTRADGFWAAKIIMNFSDEDIHAMVKAGELSRPEDANYIAKTLIERRDMIGRFWFEKANPLDDFDVVNQRLVFKDLAVVYGFYPAAGSTYSVDVIGKQGGKGKKITTLNIQEAAIALDPSWLAQYEGLDLLIRVQRGLSPEISPYVLVKVNSQGVQGVFHED
ncbi:MAG TPA: hypothetical protein VD913_00760, partial [bacterium]|nr:hypothetical protein [bacterium]